MSDSVRPHRRQPTRLPRPWDSPGKNAGVGCHSLLQCMHHAKSLQSCPSRILSRQERWSGLPFPSPLSCSVVSNSLRPHRLLPFRQECWSGMPCPPPGDLPNPRMEPRSPALQADALPSEPAGKPSIYTLLHIT